MRRAAPPLRREASSAREAEDREAERVAGDRRSQDDDGRPESVHRPRGTQDAVRVPGVLVDADAREREHEEADFRAGDAQPAER